jgi:hypothetical protein
LHEVTIYVPRQHIFNLQFHMGFMAHSCVPLALK